MTLRQLLKLDKLKDVPDWPSGNYDYFWIVNFAQGFGILPASTWMKQVFSGRFADLPSNEWGEPDGLTPDSKCDLKGATE